MTESSSSSTSELNKEPASLLDHLRSPTQPDLARKRRIPCNPPKGTKKGKGTVASEPQNVSPQDRVKQFPDDHLSVVCGNYSALLAVKTSPLRSGLKAYAK